MRLKNYAPAGNELLLELKEYSQGVVITVRPEHDKVMKILKVGPTVTILNPMTGKVAAPGDFCIAMSPNMMQFTFEGENGEKVETVQTKEFGIASFYLPDSDEKKYFPAFKEGGKVYEATRDLNVIDNPGIENSTYLKEEAENKLNLQELH